MVPGLKSPHACFRSSLAALSHHVVVVEVVVVVLEALAKSFVLSTVTILWKLLGNLKSFQIVP